jgi:hypothetical protein
MTSQAAWPRLIEFGCGFYNSNHWVYGGSGPTSLLNEIWSSSDAVSYIFRGNAAWSPRMISPLPPLNGFMYVVGGQIEGTSPPTVKDVWKSSNGVTWSYDSSIGSNSFGGMSNQVSNGLQYFRFEEDNSVGFATGLSFTF